MKNFEQLRAIDPMTADRSELVDIGTVKVNTDLPKAERLADYLEQIKNPYLFLCGGVVVHITYAETDATIEDRLEQFIRQRHDADNSHI